MKLRHKAALFTGLFSLSLGLAVVSPWVAPSQAQANFDSCTEITVMAQRVEFMTQLTQGGRTYGLFRVFDGFPEPDYAVQSVDGSGACRVDHWNPTGQPIPITDSETIPVDVAETFLGIILEDIERY